MKTTKFDKPMVVDVNVTENESVINGFPGRSTAHMLD
jgi:hypothetical protein